MFGNKKATMSTFLLFVIFILLGTNPSTMAITSDELADICQKIESAFVDIAADYETDVEPPPSFENAEMPNILITKGPTVRNWSSKRPFDEVFLSIEKSTVVNNKGNSFNSTIMQSCDRKTSRYLTKGGLSSTGEQVDFSHGVITKDKRFSIPFTVTPIAYLVLRFSYDHEKIPLSKRLRKSDFVHLNNNIEKVNDFNTICAELLWDAPNVPILHKQQTQFRIYFSKDHGYTPIRYDFMQPTKEGPEITSQVQLKSLEKISDNLWFPSKGYSKNFRSNLTNTYEATRIVVNQGLKDEDFKVEFPAGTKVDNEIEGISYVITTEEKDKEKNEKQAQEQKNTAPGFKGIDIEFNPEQAKGKYILLCFFDYQQRPSRNLVRELAKQVNEIEKKGIVVLLVHTSDIEAEELNNWIEENNIPFTCGRITGEPQKVLYQWGVRAQPWLVLADENAQIRAGGFELEQLDAILQEKIPAGPSDKQTGEISDNILIKLTDSEGLPVSGAKIGTNVRTRDDKVLNSNLSWSASGIEHNISSNWGEITLSREQLFPPYWAEGRNRGLYILHEERKIGAVCEIAKDDERQVIELTLEPVCHIYGKLDSEGLKKVGRPLTWTNVYLSWNRDSHGVMSHSSQEKRFEFYVPPGQYEFYAYGSGGAGGDPPRTSASAKHKTLTVEVKKDQRELDLGTVDLPPDKIATLIGKQAPEIGPVKAWKNGPPVTLSDLRGKVVILYFDGDSPNTSRDFPPLVELHELLHDKGLVIIAIYNCESLEQLEKNWIEVYKKFGGESEVPFLIAIDGGEPSYYEGTDKIRLGTTYAAYDITGIPTTVLIDTNGNVVGNLNLYYAKETIQKILDVKVESETEMAGWRQRFNQVYYLEEGRVLKRIAPPFIPERETYYKTEHSQQASRIERPPDFFTFHWDGKLKNWGLGFGPGKRPLERVLRSNLSMNQNQYEGPEELLEIDVPGDWIIRKDASEEQKLKALEEILANEIGWNIRFEKRTVEREAIVASGSFEYHRLPEAQDDQWVLMFSGDYVDERGGGGGTADSVREFIDAIGDRVDMPVIDETESSGQIQIPYRHYRSSYLSRIEDPAEKREKLIQLLDNISRQTNLQFKVEQRPIEKWFATEVNQ